MGANELTFNFVKGERGDNSLEHVPEGWGLIYIVARINSAYGSLGGCLSTQGAMETDRYITPNNVMNRKPTELFSEFGKRFVRRIQTP